MYISDHTPIVIQIINLTTHTVYLYPDPPTSHRSSTSSSPLEGLAEPSKTWCDAGGSCEMVWKRKKGMTRRFGVNVMGRGGVDGYTNVDQWLGEMVIKNRRWKGWTRWRQLEMNPKSYQRYPSSSSKALLNGNPMETEKSWLLSSSFNHRQRETRSRIISFIRYVSYPVSQLDTLPRAQLTLKSHPQSDRQAPRNNPHPPFTIL